MGLVEINHNPSQGELKWFGLIALLFLGIVGLVIWLRFDLLRWSVVLWILAFLLAGIFYAAPALKRPIYLIWMYAFFPLSWTVSHVLFASRSSLSRLVTRSSSARQTTRMVSTACFAHG